MGRRHTACPLATSAVPKSTGNVSGKQWRKKVYSGKKEERYNLVENDARRLRIGIAS